MAYRSEMAFLFSSAPKAKKARAPRTVKAIRVGASVKVHGVETKIVGRDTRFANAWFIEGSAFSFSRDMIVVL